VAQDPDRADPIVDIPPHYLPQVSAARRRPEPVSLDVPLRNGSGAGRYRPSRTSFPTALEGYRMDDQRVPIGDIPVPRAERR